MIVCCFGGLFFAISHLLDKLLGGLEVGQVMCRDGQRGVLGDVARRLLRTVFDDETTKAAQEHAFLVFQQTAFHDAHERFYYCAHFWF